MKEERIFSASGFAVKKFYGQRDSDPRYLERNLGEPGKFPFTRGIYPEMYRSLRGTTQNDILKEYIARNTYIFPPEQSLRLSVDIIEFCAKRMPMWHPISISGYHIRESGSSAVQELAYAFANAIDAVRFKATTGEISDVIREEYGEFHPKTII